MNIDKNAQLTPSPQEEMLAVVGNRQLTRIARNSTASTRARPAVAVLQAEQAGSSRIGFYFPWNCAGRFSMKAAMPSFWSCVANSA